MISLCIFSKNRPCQLEACLSSLINAGGIDDVHVLYTCDSKYQDGYDWVIHEHPTVTFHKEESTTRKWWKEKILSLVKSFDEYFCWGTDDSIFYRGFDITHDKLSWVFDDQDACALNLRVGKNIKWQNHWHSEKTPEIKVKHQYKDVIVYDATNISVQNDIGRAWQNDASIMPRDLYLDFLRTDKKWWKGKGCRELDNLAQSGNVFNPRIVGCFEKSVYINVPVNLVHVLNDGRLYADNWGKFHRSSISALHNKFMKGEYIDWQAIIPENTFPDCGRVEVEYKFK